MIQALECRVPPVAQVLLVAAAMWGLSHTGPGLWAFLPGYLGFFCLLPGAVLAALGVWEFRKAGTTVDPRAPRKTQTLVDTGVYRLSRNPMYVGFFLLLLGWAFYLGRALPFAMLPVFVAYMTRFQILPEERCMRERFGSDFVAYAARVRRWL